MSFQIQQPGFYRQRSGGKAEVFAERDGWWYGLRPSRDPSGEKPPVPCSWESDGVHHARNMRHPDDLIAVWHDIPEPPAGFRVMPGDYVANIGDMGRSDSCSGWFALDAWCHRTATQIREHVGSEWFYVASPIPAPPKIEPGDGWRLLEDDDVIAIGDEYQTVFDHFPRNWRHCCSTIGSQFGDEKNAGIFVARRRIPAPFPVELGKQVNAILSGKCDEPETWTPTCELQLHEPNRRTYNGWMDLSGLVQQRWTCGERSEWRPVPLEAAT